MSFYVIDESGNELVDESGNNLIHPGLVVECIPATADTSAAAAWVRLATGVEITQSAVEVVWLASNPFLRVTQSVLELVWVNTEVGSFAGSGGVILSGAATLDGPRGFYRFFFGG